MEDEVLRTSPHRSLWLERHVLTLSRDGGSPQEKIIHDANDLVMEKVKTHTKKTIVNELSKEARLIRAFQKRRSGPKGVSSIQVTKLRPPTQPRTQPETQP